MPILRLWNSHSHTLTWRASYIDSLCKRDLFSINRVVFASTLVTSPRGQFHLWRCGHPSHRIAPRSGTRAPIGSLKKNVSKKNFMNEREEQLDSVFGHTHSGHVGVTLIRTGSDHLSRSRCAIAVADWWRIKQWTVSAVFVHLVHPKRKQKKKRPAFKNNHSLLCVKSISFYIQLCLIECVRNSSRNRK